MNLPDKNLCTGCGSCVNVCSKGALKLKIDSEGFLYPVLSEELCGGCKKCEKVCPLVSSPDKSEIKFLYAASAKSTDTERTSSSGGAFSLLAEYVISQGGVVYAAGFDENFNVCHKRVSEIEDIKFVRGSKYVQSRFESAAECALEDLDNGKEVLFAATPCQIAAFKNMAKCSTGKLYTVDFICHGVASPGLFNKYRDFISKGKKINDISFRDKTDGWHKYSLKMSFDDGSVYRKHVVDDPYMLAFAQNVSLRKSCYNCAFVGVGRCSDITLGDAWTQSFESKELSDGRGVSLVSVSTEKGRMLFDAVKDKAYTEELSLDELAKIRPLNKPTSYNPVRKPFLRDMNKLEINKLSAKYCGNSLTAKLRRLIIKKTHR